MTGLVENQRVIVSLPKNRKARGVIREVYEKSYKVGFLGWEGRYSAAKVKPESSRKPTAKLIPVFEPYCPILTMRIGEKPVQAVPKAEPPELCPAWLAFVRKQPCCNCGSTQNIEAHHEGRKGLSQKVRDTMAVPLCSRCHRTYTDKNRLPSYIGGIYQGRLLSRESSLSLLQDAQYYLLLEAMQSLAQSDRIELLSKGIAKIRGLAQLLGRIDEAA